MTSGVYTVHLTGTPFVWVGESGNIEKRFKVHYKQWVWPNDATYNIVREMPNSKQSERVVTEGALSRLLSRKGLCILSETCEHSGRRGGNLRIPDLKAMPSDERKKIARLGGLAVGKTSGTATLRQWRKDNPETDRQMRSENGKQNKQVWLEAAHSWLKSDEGIRTVTKNLVEWNRSDAGRKSRSESNRRRCQVGKCGHPSHKNRK